MNFPADLKYTKHHEWIRVELEELLSAEDYQKLIAK